MLPTRQPILSVGMMAVGMVAVVAALVRPTAAVAQEPALPGAASPVTYFAVDSRQGWQKTGFFVNARDFVRVDFVSGSWSVDTRNFPRVGPDGYPPEIDSKIYQGCKFVSGANYGVLLASTEGGEGEPAAVGGGRSFVAGTSEQVVLRIHDGDNCLGDNGGSVTVSITKW